MNIINDSSQFVVLQNDDHISVRMDELQEQMAPIAKKENYINGIPPIPGLMYPGEGISYAEETGEISVVVPRIPVFQGIVGAESGMKTVPTGDEIYDDYYVVATPSYTLNNSWGEVSGQVVNINDKITCGDENKGQDRWYIVPDFLGQYSVLEVLPADDTPSVSVDATDVQRPKISIADALPFQDADNPGMSGLMPPDALKAVEDLDDVYIRRAFTEYPPVP